MFGMSQDQRTCPNGNKTMMIPDSAVTVWLLQRELPKLEQGRHWTTRRNRSVFSSYMLPVRHRGTKRRKTTPRRWNVQCTGKRIPSSVEIVEIGPQRGYKEHPGGDETRQDKIKQDKTQRKSEKRKAKTDGVYCKIVVKWLSWIKLYWIKLTVASRSVPYWNRKSKI